ncbi:HPF/RaiA family ribosome-associated protein [bacterium]|nr:HPF/RaiA family ribosome-associated protein [bacterium]
MHKRITFKGIDHSDAVENYANDQLAKVIDFLGNERSPIYIDLMFKPSKLRAHHFVELRIKSPNYSLISSYEGTNFYNTLDRVIDVMYRELHESKKKLNDKKKSCGRHDEFKKER